MQLSRTNLAYAAALLAEFVRDADELVTLKRQLFWLLLQSKRRSSHLNQDLA